MLVVVAHLLVCYGRKFTEVDNKAKEREKMKGREGKFKLQRKKCVKAIYVEAESNQLLSITEKFEVLFVLLCHI